MNRATGRARGAWILAPYSWFVVPGLFALATVLLAICSGGPAPSETPSGATPLRRQTTQPPLASPAQTPVVEPKAAEEIARRFMEAFLDRRYDRMWTMLAPQAQQRWPDPQAFADFLSRKFGSFQMTYQLGPPAPAPDGSSTAVPVSLAQKDSDAVYAGPPLLFVRLGDSLGVADAGPLGPHGPIVAAPSPLLNELTVPILIYHHFAPQLPQNYQERLATVTTEAFTQQLDWLSQEGYASITLPELFNAFYYGLPLPAKPIILIFDDGYEDAYLHAFPLLQQRGFGATVAMISGFIGQPGYLTWDQIREMAAAGLQFVSHTANHVNLAAASPETARSELAESKRALEEGLGRSMQFLVYPFGEPFVSGSQAVQERILALLPQEGYVGGLLTSSGPPYISVQRTDSPYQLHRIPVSGGETLARFAASIRVTP